MWLKLYKNKKIMFFVLLNLIGCMSDQSFKNLSEVPEDVFIWDSASSQKISHQLEENHLRAQHYNQELREKKGLKTHDQLNSQIKILHH